MSEILHIGTHVDNFKAFPSAAFAIVLANDASKLAAPDARDKIRAVAITDELTPERVGQLRFAAQELGRLVLLFARWEVFSAALRCLRSPAA